MGSGDLDRAKEDLTEALKLESGNKVAPTPTPSQLRERRSRAPHRSLDLVALSAGGGGAGELVDLGGCGSPEMNNILDRAKEDLTEALKLEPGNKVSSSPPPSPPS